MKPHRLPSQFPLQARASRCKLYLSRDSARRDKEIRRGVWEEVEASVNRLLLGWRSEPTTSGLGPLGQTWEACTYTSRFVFTGSMLNPQELIGMRYNNHTMREALHARDRDLFDAYGAGNMFLAKGYGEQEGIRTLRSASGEGRKPMPPEP